MIEIEASTMIEIEASTSVASEGRMQKFRLALREAMLHRIANIASFYFNHERATMPLIAAAGYLSLSPWYNDLWKTEMQTENGADIPVYVAGDALLAFDPTPPCVDGNYRIEGEYLSKIEKAASDKYDGGSKHVHIARDDIDY
jgi:hypothetical protein